MARETDTSLNLPAARADPRSCASAEPTKIACVITHLRREDGATLLELAAATKWQPHTIRAALTGLKRKGHLIEKGQRRGMTCYYLPHAGAGRSSVWRDMARTPLDLATDRTTPDADEASPIAWPRIAELGASEHVVARRRRYIGGSDANTILSGSAERIERLWREKRGDELPEDLSSKLPVMLGCWTEAFNRQWYERFTGQAITRLGEWVRCGTHDWRACTLDGFLGEAGAVWEAKHTSSFMKGEDLLARYMPQLQHNMAVTGATTALLSVIFGNGKWECFEVSSDWLYQQDLLEAETRFWNCVVSGEPPVAAPVPPAPKPVGVREICLDGNNLWAASAADWLLHGEAAKKHAAACVALRELVEPDVARAFGHGIEAKRSKTGAITIRELRS